jgi:hypothetical protein
MNSEEKSMEDTYKHHKIIASTWQLSDSGHWEPRVLVTWTKGNNKRKNPWYSLAPFPQSVTRSWRA